MRPLHLLLLVITITARAESVTPTLTQKQLRAIGYKASQSLSYAPQPQYPLEARRHRFTGSGIFIIRIPVKTGVVAEVRVARSTGHAILDSAAVMALRKWRFKPGILQPIGEISPQRHDSFGKTDALLKVPINFTM